MQSPAGTSTAADSGIPVRDKTIPDSYAIRFGAAAVESHGNGPPAFTLVVKNRCQFGWLPTADAYSAAVASVPGEFDVQRDLAAAVRFHGERGERSGRGIVHSAAARFAPRRIETWLQTRDRAGRKIRLHHDRSIEFHKSFLDPRMVDVCAYFRRPDVSVDEAQQAKLERVCRKLDLKPRDRFLAIGGGWGAWLFHVAEPFGVYATENTSSGNQARHARGIAANHPEGPKVTIEETGFRAVRGRFDKIASVGMFEHVGRRRLRGCFRKVYELLQPDGLFLNHGIVRPQFVGDGSQTLFLQQKAFRGGELAHLADIIRSAELNGFEVRDVEHLQPPCALTRRAWVERSQHHQSACLKAAGAAVRGCLPWRVQPVYFDSSASSVGQTFLRETKESGTTADVGLPVRAGR